MTRYLLILFSLTEREYILKQIPLKYINEYEIDFKESFLYADIKKLQIVAELGLSINLSATAKKYPENWDNDINLKLLDI